MLMGKRCDDFGGLNGKMEDGQRLHTACLADRWAPVALIAAAFPKKLFRKRIADHEGILTLADSVQQGTACQYQLTTFLCPAG